MSERLVGSTVAIVLLASLLVIAGTSHADTGVVRAMIAGALTSPTVSDRRDGLGLPPLR